MKLILLAALLPAGCDAVEPAEPEHLVVESFVAAGEPLPGVRVRRTKPLSEPYGVDDPSTLVSDAAVDLRLDGRLIPYRPDPGRPGHYLPAVEEIAASRARFDLSVRWNDRHATASGSVPPPIRMDSLRVRVPERPVKAVFADSLSLTDSLSLNVREGYIYQVEVTVFWRSDLPEAGADSAYWVRARIQPPASFPSAVVGWFLRTDQVQRERLIPRDASGRRQWTGIYAVAVEGPDAPMPPHDLSVSLLRSGADYAQYAATRRTPDRREPVSNVQGGIGIVAGIAVDRGEVRVEPGG